MSRRGVLCVALFVLLFPALLFASELRVAVASNFSRTLAVLVAAYSRVTNDTIVVIPGSTGKLYAQIMHGAPFDLFLAADRQRPALLEKADVGQKGTRVTYAVGRLVLWSTMPGGFAGDKMLSDGAFGHLSMANPELAPYGRAAKELLIHQGLWDRLQSRLVRGENVGQAFQFVRSGNAETGFVALSQILGLSQKRGTWWEVPASLYSPIEQQAVLLSRNQAARRFWIFLQKNAVRNLIRAQGYRVP